MGLDIVSLVEAAELRVDADPLFPQPGKALVVE
jgi:hypothetical protein